VSRRGGPRIARSGELNRVVVGVDRSAASDLAVRWTGDEADRHDVELVVVHSWSYPYTPMDATSRRRASSPRSMPTALTRSEAARKRCGVTTKPKLVSSGRARLFGDDSGPRWRRCGRRHDHAPALLAIAQHADRLILLT
jgi:nucleotide-binding universal stress UspA family protein